MYKRTLFFLLMLSGLALAQFEGIKIMVNPGHGGHDSDDRYIAATGFWESEGNLTKGLYLRDLLEARGAEVIISRTQNRTEDDLPLSQISAIANSNNVDLFHSIHSNGFQGNANYVVMLYKEVNGAPAHPKSKQICDIMGPYLHNSKYTSKTYTRGDKSFLGFNLGVLKNLKMPGALSEGSFHDYIPESWRLMNIPYRQHEATAILRAMLDYFGLPKLEHGSILGLSRDKTKNVSYTWVSSLPNDKFKPINNLKAYLYKDDVLLKSFQGDQKHNGLFLFDSLAPGPYKVIVNYGAYKNDTTTINVSAHQTTVKHFAPIAQPQKAPEVYTVLPQDGTVDVNTYGSVTITFSRPMQKDSTEAGFIIEPAIEGSFSWSQSNQVLHYTPKVAFTPATDYTVTLSSKTQSSNNVPLAQHFSFSFTSAADHIYPTITETSPANGDSISIYENIMLHFDQKMVPTTVEHAFSITPHVEGSFSWADGNKQLIFNPKTTLGHDTEYDITLTSSAVNTKNVGLKENFTLPFKTYSRNALSVDRFYPADGDTNISKLVNFYCRFDAVVNAQTVLSNVALYDADGNKQELTNYTLKKSNNRSIFRFEAAQPLKRGKFYKVEILPGIKDSENLPLEDTLKYHFKTSVENYISGTIVDNFEINSGWKNPEESSLTTGIDAQNTFFNITSLSGINSVKSGRITYQFTEDSLGLCHVMHSSGFNISGSDSSETGLWIFGDLSGNTVELGFKTSAQSQEMFIADTLNFSGWKLLRLPLSEFGQSQFTLSSLLVRQLKSGEKQGEVFLDNLQTDVVTAIQKQTPQGVIKQFTLSQNWPNPFNPLTHISFNLPEAAKVKLIVFNNLGQKVATLASGNYPAGVFKVSWNAAQFSSGIYYYKLNAVTHSGRRFSQSKKLLLLK